MSEDKITITRKYVLKPTFAETKEWTKKIMSFTKNSYEEKIDYYKKKVKSEKDKKKKEQYKNRLSQIEEQYKDFIENGTLIQSNINDYTYDLVRRSMESETRRKNHIITYVIGELYRRDAENMSFKDRNDLINELTKYGYRQQGNKDGSLFDDIEVDNPLKGYGIAFSQNLTSEIKDLVNKKGLLDGHLSSSKSYKFGSPFTVAKAFMSFSHDYDSYEELCEHIQENGCNLYFNFGSNGNPTIARFKLDLGANRCKNNKQELIATILNVYSGEYTFCGSGIGIEKNKIILYLSLSIPKKSVELDENVVVGVDLGIAVPAMCAVNNNPKSMLRVGSKDEFLRVRTKIKAQRERLQKGLKSAAGGHGRKKKLSKLDTLKKYERHFVETKYHKYSKQIVDYALKNRAKYINIENLSDYKGDKFILRNWSYYTLQQFITYKALKYGIIVRKINPCYTSQVCSVCGNWHPENRKEQAVFNCHNEECDTHDKRKYKYGMNADFNAARNIANSTLWMEKGKVTEKKKEEARIYYGIEEEYQKFKTEEENKKKSNKKNNDGVA